MKTEKIIIASLSADDRLKEANFSSFKGSFNLASLLQGEQYQEMMTIIEVLRSNVITLFLSSVEEERHKSTPEIKHNMELIVKSIYLASDEIIKSVQEQKRSAN